MRNSRANQEKSDNHKGINPIVILLMLCLLLLLIIIFREQLYSFVEQLMPTSGGLVEDTVTVPF